MNEYWVGAALLSLGYTMFALKKAFSYDKPKDKPPLADSIVDGPIKYPGYIPFRDTHGCYVAKFSNVDDLNSYFKPERAGWLKNCIELYFQPNGDIYAVISNSLNDEMKEEIAEWSYAQHQHFEQKREQKRQELLERTKAAAQKEAEAKEYETIGRRYVKDKNLVRLMPAGSKEREEAEKKLNKGELNE